MGLFDKLKSLVSDDKKDTGTIEIIAPLSGEIVNIEDVPDVVFAEKIVGDGIAIKPKFCVNRNKELTELCSNNA